MNFPSALISWYIENKRELPWRNTKDPYLIWLSEIILQQTKVEQGMPYYLKFSEKYPTVTDLAAAEEDEVLKLWQGLGYYSRARNLLYTAKTVTLDFKGSFPADYSGLKALKGIGDYTASAIASFAYDLPHPVIDGNVFRFFSRVFGINTPINSLKGRKVFSELAEELIDRKKPALFNQAVMEFGATICKPKQPACPACPFVENCHALKNNSIKSLPVKTNKTKQKNRFFYYFHLRKNKQTILQKRTGNDIWKNLYEFPLLELPSREEPATLLKNDLLKKTAGENWSLISISREYKHILTHQVIYAVFYEIEINRFNTQKNMQIINNESIEKFAVSRLMDKYLKNKNGNKNK